MNNKKMLYVHIGMPKTGSSAIQALFACNADVLSKYNYVFPWHPGFGQSFQTSAGNATKLHHWVINNQIEDFENAINQLTEKNIILSSEVLFHTARLHPEIFSKMIENFDFKIICYIRKIDDLIDSCVNQLVKNHNFTSYENLISIVDDHDYASTLINLTQFISKDKISIRLYDRESFTNNSIYEDILEAVELDCVTNMSEMIEPDKVINPSLSPEAFELRMLLNKLSIDEANGQEKYHFNGILAKYSVENKKDKFSILSFHEREKVFEYFKLKEIDLNKLFFNKDERIFEKVSVINKPIVTDLEISNVLMYIKKFDSNLFSKITSLLLLNSRSRTSKLLKVFIKYILSELPPEIYKDIVTTLYRPLLAILPYNFKSLTDGYSKDLSVKRDDNDLMLSSHGDDPYFSIHQVNCNKVSDIFVKITLTSNVESVSQLHYQTLDENYFGNKKFKLHKLVVGDNELTFRIQSETLNGYFRFDPIMKPGQVNVHSIVFYGNDI